MATSMPVASLGVVSTADDDEEDGPGLAKILSLMGGDESESTCASPNCFT